MYRVAGLIGKSVSRRAWCRDHMHLQTPPLPASTSRADMLRLNRETAVLLLACQSGIRLSSRLENKPSSTLKVRASGVEHNRCGKRGEPCWIRTSDLPIKSHKTGSASGREKVSKSG